MAVSPMTDANGHRFLRLNIPAGEHAIIMVAFYHKKAGQTPPNLGKAVSIRPKDDLSGSQEIAQLNNRNSQVGLYVISVTAAAQTFDLYPLHGGDLNANPQAPIDQYYGAAPAVGAMLTEWGWEYLISAVLDEQKTGITIVLESGIGPIGGNGHEDAANPAEGGENPAEVSTTVSESNGTENAKISGRTNSSPSVGTDYGDQEASSPQ